MGGSNRTPVGAGALGDWYLVRDKFRCRLMRHGPVDWKCDHRDPARQAAAPRGTWRTFKRLCRGCHIRKTAGERFEELPPDVKAWRELVISRMV